MCEDMKNNIWPYHAARAGRLRQLCRLLGLDAILLVTGWDGCYNLGSKSLVEWLCERPGAQPADTEDALEEGLFVITPDDVAWFITHETDIQMQAQNEHPAAAAAAATPPAGCSACSSSAADPMQLSPAHSYEQEPTMHDSWQQHQQQQRQQQQHPGCSDPSQLARQCSCGVQDQILSLDHTAANAAAAAGSSNNAAAVQQVSHIDGKLSLLLQLRPSLKRVGVPLGIEVLIGQQHQVNASSILKWPLLMALAETVGVQMDELFQDVVDISPELPSFLAVVDGTQLFHVLRVRRPQLHRSWLEAMSGCWRRSSGPKSDLSEAAMAAPLTEFIAGCGCRLNLGQYQPLALPPRVLFGHRSSQPGALSSDGVTLRSLSAQEGHAVLHATAEAADACCGLRFARTVFFSQGAARQGGQQLQGALPDGQICGQVSGQTPGLTAGQTPGQTCGQTLVDFEVDQQDLFDLLHWYQAVVEAAWSGMRHFATQSGATPESMHACIASTFTAAATAAGLPPACITPDPTAAPPPVATAGDSSYHPQQQQQQQEQPQLTVQLLSWEGGPRPMPVPHSVEQYNMRFKTVRAVCSGIRSRSPAHCGVLLGSVMYGDTFLEVPAIGSSPAQLVNLTLTHCPLYTFNFWGTEAAENNMLVSSFRRHLQLQLQVQLTAQASAQLQVHMKAQGDVQARKAPAHTAAAAATAAGVAQVPANEREAAAAADVKAAAAAAAAAQRSSVQPMQLQHQHLLMLQQHLQQQQQALAAAAAPAATGKKGQRRLSTPEKQQSLTAAAAAAAKKALRRYSTPEQQQLLAMQQHMMQQQQQHNTQAQGLLQQYAAVNDGQQAAARKQQATFQQQLLMQLQASSSRQQQQQQQSGKHLLAAAGSGDPASLALADGLGGSSSSSSGAMGGSGKAIKRSCCGPNSSSRSSPPPAAAASAAGSAMLERSPTPPVPPLVAAAAAVASPVPSSPPSPSRRAAVAAVAAAAAAAAAVPGSVVFDPTVLLQRLGQLLVPQGEMPGEIGLVFTGANKLAVMDGPLYPHQAGLAFVSRPSKVHLLPLELVESVWLQDLGGGVTPGPSQLLPGHAAAVGPCLVLKGKQPACGLLPAAHLTDNPHIAIPLRAMTKTCREHWVTVVLPAWQTATGIVTNSQGAAAAWPLPPELQPAYRYWLQGPRKRYLVLQPDEVMDTLLLNMDKPQQQQQQQQQQDMGA